MKTPYLLYSDGEGKIFEDLSLYTVGRSGWDAMPIPRRGLDRATRWRQPL